MRTIGTGGPRGNRNVLFVWATAAAVCAPLVSRAQAPPSFNISTIIGSAGGGFSGDSGPAASAQINDPCALLVDGSGNIYIGDQLNYRVRKIAGGNISTVVGNGTAGDTGATGSGGAATSAEIRTPCGLALDRSGNLYLSDTANHEIKKVTTGGTITIVAGNGTGGFAGNNHPGTQAQLNNPVGLVVDSAGNLYIADSGNNQIRVLNPAGNMSAYAGNTTAGYLGDNGAAGAAELDNPTDIAMDGAGNLYIADTNNGVIRKVTPGGGSITTVAGNGFSAFSGDGGQATQAALNRPRGVALDSAGNIYIADTLNSRIRVVTPDGLIHTVAGTGALGNGGDGGPATRAALFFPTVVRVDASGNVYVADSQNSAIRLLTPVAVPTEPPTVSGVNSASEFGASSAAAPGSWIEVHGANLAANTRLWTTGDFNGNQAPISLDLTSVAIAGQHAFVYAISPNQVNVQVPFSVTPGPQQLTVTTPAGTSPPVTVTVKATQPGLYAPAVLSVSGKQYTAQYNDATRTFIMPAGAVSGINSQPAHVGDLIVLYGVGFGPVTPNVDAGQTVQQLNTLTSPVQFSVGGAPATLAYAGLAPQAIGLYQFNLTVPNVAPGSTVPITFTQGGVAGTQTLYIAVQ
jgi:trimeric autotransporter adhesin